MNIAVQATYSPSYRAKFPAKKISSIDLAYEKELTEIKRAKADQLLYEKLDPSVPMERVKCKLQNFLNGMNRK